MTAHPDDAAFLAAILANPGDDLVRLVYADFLNETGRGERAEFIRVQCELARLPAGPLYIDPDSAADRGELRRAVTLCRREAELWAALRVYLDAHAFQTGDERFPLTVEYRRGFVFRVACTWDDWRRHATDLRAAAPLERVTLTTRPDIEELLPVNGMRIYRLRGGTKVRCYDPAESADERLLGILAAEYPGLAFDLPPPDNRITITNVPLYVSDLSAPTGIPWESVDSGVAVGAFDAADDFQLARMDADCRILVAGIPPVEWVRQSDGSWHATGPNGHRFVIPAGEVNEPPGATP